MNVKVFFGYMALLLIAFGVTAAGVNAQTNSGTPHILAFEVAEDGARFVFDDLNLFDDGMPGYGSAFVTQGYIYPVGTLDGSNGVLENGAPEFPEAVLGEWTCFGWMIGDGAHTTTGEWVVSTQVYQFNDGSTIVTDGFELIDFDVPVTRAITGGTQAYRDINGEMVQTLRGFTDAMGVNLSVEFHVDDMPEVVAASSASSAPSTLSVNDLQIYPWG